LTPLAESREPVSYGNCGEALSIVEKCWVRENENAGSGFRNGAEGRLIVAGIARFHDLKLDAQSLCGFSSRFG